MGRDGPLAHMAGLKGSMLTEKKSALQPAGGGREGAGEPDRERERRGFGREREFRNGAGDQGACLPLVSLALSLHSLLAFHTLCLLAAGLTAPPLAPSVSLSLVAPGDPRRDLEFRLPVPAAGLATAPAALAASLPQAVPTLSPAEQPVSWLLRGVLSPGPQLAASPAQPLPEPSLLQPAASVLQQAPEPVAASLLLQQPSLQLAASLLQGPSAMPEPVVASPPLQPVASLLLEALGPSMAPQPAVASPQPLQPVATPLQQAWLERSPAQQPVAASPLQPAASLLQQPVLEPSPAPQPAAAPPLLQPLHAAPGGPAMLPVLQPAASLAVAASAVPLVPPPPPPPVQQASEAASSSSAAPVRRPRPRGNRRVSDVRCEAWDCSYMRESGDGCLYCAVHCEEWSCRVHWSRENSCSCGKPRPAECVRQSCKGCCQAAEAQDIATAAAASAES